MDISKIPQDAAGIRTSKLERTLTETDIPLRAMERKQEVIHRHASEEYKQATNRELDFDYDLITDEFPFDSGSPGSLQDIMDAVQYYHHLKNERNLSTNTNVRCLNVNGRRSSMMEYVDGESLQEIIEEATKPLPQVPGPDDAAPSALQRLIHGTPGTSYGSQVSLTLESVKSIFSAFDINPAQLLNLFGRPDYWAPFSRWESSPESSFTACDFSCQHPRWNIQVQGAPLSVYARVDAVAIHTVYVISHKMGDSNVDALWKLLELSVKTTPEEKLWEQIDQVDDQLAGLSRNNRSKLGQLTRQLQVISQSADSHLANAEISLFNSRGMESSHTKLHSFLAQATAGVSRAGRPSSGLHQKRAADAISYTISSMQKQKIWFLNYKQRKDLTMNLVYNLVTQQDAANNILLASEMEKDSTSMNAIAGLTMTFLPGTFTATLLNIESVKAVSPWWLWAVLTVPLTLSTFLGWWIYKRKNLGGLTPTETDPEVAAVVKK